MSSVDFTIFLIPMLVVGFSLGAISAFGLRHSSESKFLKISCPRCNRTHTIFGKSSTWIKCESCNKLLVKPKGGKAKVRAPVRKVL